MSGLSLSNGKRKDGPGGSTSSETRRSRVEWGAKDVEYRLFNVFLRWPGDVMLLRLSLKDVLTDSQRLGNLKRYRLIFHSQRP